MKKLKIKIDFKKYNLKDNLLLGVILIDCCILIWIIFDIVRLSIYNLFVIAVVLNAIFVILYNRYSDNKNKSNNEKKKVKDNENN